MTTPEPSSPNFSVEVADHYLGKKGEAYFQYQGQHVEIGGQIDAQKFAPYIKESDTVLDFGCGSGAVLANVRAATRIGVEPNPAARAFCSTSTGGAVRTFASIEQIPDRSVDVAISNHCLEHVPNPSAALRQMHRVLKPGGRLVVFLPIDDWRTQRRYDRSDINHHLHTWSPLLFGHTLAESGFTGIEVEVFSRAFPPKYDVLFRRLPGWMFDMISHATAVLVKRRQIRAIAERSKSAPAEGS